MAVVFGDKYKDEGWIQVTCIQWIAESAEGGFSVNREDIPEYPEVPRGKISVRLYNPELNEWRFDLVDVPLTQEQLLEDLIVAVRELTAAFKERK